MKGGFPKEIDFISKENPTMEKDKSAAYMLKWSPLTPERQ
jgi:hypothetical protein